MQNIQSLKLVQLERELAHLLLTISRLETNIEEYRINLAENDKFNAEDAFEKIDHNSHGYLLISDFTYFFSANHMPVLERECYYVFNFYCNENGKRMEFNDFLKMVTPATNAEVRDRFLRRAATRKRKMPFFLVDQLAQLVQKELEFFLKTETMKMNLMHTYGWNTLKAFAMIDRMAKGYIDYKDVSKLMEKIGEVFSEEDYRALARRLDRDFNERLTKNEFCDALLPNDVSREDVEIRQANFLDKSPDYFYNPAKAAMKANDIQITQKRRKYLNQNINLLNQEYDNVFSAEEELKHIKPYLRNQEDVLAFANENFYKQRSVKPLQQPPNQGNYGKEVPDLGETKLLQKSRAPEDSRLNRSENVNASMLRNSKKRIFDNYNLSISPLKKSADLLRQSMDDVDQRSQINSNYKQGSQYQPSINKTAKLAHLFQKNKYK